MENYTFHIADGIILAILGISAVVGFVRGFSREMLSIGSWMLALFTALYAHSYTFPFWTKIIDYQVLAHVVTFAVVFIGVLTTSLIVTNGWANRIGDGPLGSLDRTLGLLFGVTRGSVIVCLGYLILASLGDSKDDVPGWLKEAKSLAWIEEGGAMMVTLLPEQMRDPVAATIHVVTASEGKTEKPALQPQRYAAPPVPVKPPAKRTAAAHTAPVAAAVTSKKVPAENLDRQGMDALMESLE
jgi:membrane protein required for colicin V production